MNTSATTTKATPTAQQTKTAAKINAIRAAHGNPMLVCCLCGRAAANPYRRYDARGKVTEGCVDAFHHGHLIGESAAWHTRPVAAQLRRETLADLEAL